MKEILIDKVIGSDFWEEGIMANDIQAELDKAKNESQIRIVIDSPGGSVFEAIGICGAIKDFARKNQECQIETYIRGLAASAASLIALAAKYENPKNKVVCESSSVFMIHRASSVQRGNANDMQKTADRLHQIDENLQIPIFCAITKKGAEEIRQKVDEETYFFGQEIVDYGFADEVLSLDKKPDNMNKAFALENAKARFVVTMKKPKEFDLKQIAAILREEPKTESALPKGDGKNKKKESRMTLDELKQNEPDVYAKAVEEGVQKERARVGAHLNKAEKIGCLDVAVGFIRDGASANDEKVFDKYFEAGRVLAEQKLRDGENPKDLKQGQAGKNGDVKAMLDEFERGFKEGGWK